ncbi:MAG: T9SS type A sorting domain-containing protein, partial [bacterium]
RSEVSIAAGNPNGIVVGWNDAQGFCFLFPSIGCDPGDQLGLSGFGFSTNRGVSFGDGGAPPPLPFDGDLILTRGDPALASTRADNGPFYYANLALSLSQSTAGIIVHMGQFDSDGDLSWDPAKTRFLEAGPSDFFDKELIDVQPGRGRTAYISYTNFTAPNFFGQIELFRTRDQGNNWLGPVVVQPEISTDFFTGTVLQGSEPAIAEDNKTVYVVFEQGPRFDNNVGFLDYQIQVARSDNRGASFGPSVKVADINGMFLRAAPVGYNRSNINDFPRIAVVRGGPHRGRVVVVYHSAKDPLSTDTDVFLSYSDDRGETWTQVTLSDDEGVQEFWPDLDIGKNGTIAVQYYRGVPGTTEIFGTPFSTTFVNTFLVVSTDGGYTFGSPIKVSERTSDWTAAFTNIVPNFGDYNTVVVSGNQERIFCSWAGDDEIVNIPFFESDFHVPATIFAEVTGANFYKSTQYVIRDLSETTPESYALNQNYPNPFNPETTITFALPKDNHVTLKIYDLLGQEVGTLVDEERPAGNYRIPFKASELPSGTYFYKLVAGDFVSVKRMTLLR